MKLRILKLQTGTSTLGRAVCTFGFVSVSVMEIRSHLSHFTREVKTFTQKLLSFLYEKEDCICAGPTGLHFTSLKLYEDRRKSETNAGYIYTEFWIWLKSSISFSVARKLIILCK